MRGNFPEKETCQQSSPEPRLAVDSECLSRHSLPWATCASEQRGPMEATALPSGSPVLCGVQWHFKVQN